MICYIGVVPNDMVDGVNNIVAVLGEDLFNVQNIVNQLNMDIIGKGSAEKAHFPLVFCPRGIHTGLVCRADGRIKGISRQSLRLVLRRF